MDNLTIMDNLTLQFCSVLDHKMKRIKAMKNERKFCYVLTGGIKYEGETILAVSFDENFVDIFTDQYIRKLFPNYDMYNIVKYLELGNISECITIKTIYN